MGRFRWKKEGRSEYLMFAGLSLYSRYHISYNQWTRHFPEMKEAGISLDLDLFGEWYALIGSYATGIESISVSHRKNLVLEAVRSLEALLQSVDEELEEWQQECNRWVSRAINELLQGGNDE